MKLALKTLMMARKDLVSENHAHALRRNDCSVENIFRNAGIETSALEGRIGLSAWIGPRPD